MLKLHFAPNSRASRTLWLLEELGLEYELNRMDFSPQDLKSDAHRARHPLGRVPVLEDGEVSIFESGAIAEYILERHKKPETVSRRALPFRHHIHRSGHHRGREGTRPRFLLSAATTP